MAQWADSGHPKESPLNSVCLYVIVTILQVCENAFSWFLYNFCHMFTLALLVKIGMTSACLLRNLELL